MSENLRERLGDELRDLRGQMQLRSLEQIKGINLCSNDYLGLSTDPRLREAVHSAVKETRSVASTGSRLLSGNSADWEHLESDFADFAGTEAALYFTSGYAANIGLLSALLQPSDIVFSDSLNHASIIDGIRLSRAQKIIYRHCDLDTLRENLDKYCRLPGTRIIITESVFSMDGDLAPLPELFQLAKEYGAELIIDEAHATGVFGPNGRGCAAQHGIEKEVLAVVHTCGKALASMGAFVCSGRVLKEYLINRARTFIFSTGAPPYLTDQIRAAVHLAASADRERTHLLAIQQLVRGRLRDAGLDVRSSQSQIIPIVLGSNEAALLMAKQLQIRGIAVRAIRPPTVPKGTARLRLSLTTRISAEQALSLVDELFDSFEQTRKYELLRTHG